MYKLEHSIILLYHNATPYGSHIVPLLRASQDLSLVVGINAKRDEMGRS